jgi:putative inorganic carbon (HCO3(-)) transporter
MPIDVRRFFARLASDASLSSEIAYRTLFAVVLAVACSISLFEFVSWIFIVFAAWSLAVGRDFSKLRKWSVFLAVGYLLFTLFSLTQSQYLDNSLRGVFKTLRNVLLFFAAVHVVDSERRFKAIFKWFLGVAVFIALDAAAQGFLKFDLIAGRRMTPFQGDAKRLTGPFRHANDFSAYLSLVIFLFLGVLLEARKLFGARFALFCKAGFWIVALCLFGTYSRGAWLAVGISFVRLTVLKRSRLFAASLVAVVVWACLFSPPLVRDRLNSLRPGQGTVVEREELWLQSARMIRKSPWFGLGSNTYSKNQPHFRSPGTTVDNQYAHNGYLQMAADIGLLGLAAFLAALAAALVTSLRAFFGHKDPFLRAAGIGFVCGITAFLLHSATDTDLQSLLLVNLLWLSLGVMCAAARIAREHVSA